jgi:uncharacterized membrane protein YccF (DUF307 family)
MNIWLAVGTMSSLVQDSYSGGGYVVALKGWLLHALVQIILKITLPSGLISQQHT